MQYDNGMRPKSKKELSVKILTSTGVCCCLNQSTISYPLRIKLPVMPPTICAITQKKALTGVISPTTANERLTAGLTWPPDTGPTN